MGKGQSNGEWREGDVVTGRRPKRDKNDIYRTPLGSPSADLKVFLTYRGSAIY